MPWAIHWCASGKQRRKPGQGEVEASAHEAHELPDAPVDRPGGDAGGGLERAAQEARSTCDLGMHRLHQIGHAPGGSIAGAMDVQAMFTRKWGKLPMLLPYRAEMALFVLFRILSLAWP